MRSTRPIPGNPWPHDMVLTVADDVKALEDLLWVREAWSLEPVGDDLPPLLAESPVPETRPRGETPGPRAADIAAWALAWPDLWHACLVHAGARPDPSLVDRLGSPILDPQERRALLERLVGPSVTDVFGDAAFTAGHEAWTLRRFERRASPDALRADRERHFVEHLVPAWLAGLTTVVVIPCRGSFTRKVGEHALLVTAETRDDDAAYAAALDSFA